MQAKEAVPTHAEKWKVPRLLCYVLVNIFSEHADCKIEKLILLYNLNMILISEL
jgi:hypothetical protein